MPGGCQGYLWGVWWRPGKVSGRSWRVLGAPGRCWWSCGEPGEAQGGPGAKNVGKRKVFGASEEGRRSPNRQQHREPGPGRGMGGIRSGVFGALRATCELPDASQVGEPSLFENVKKPLFFQRFLMGGALWGRFRACRACPGGARGPFVEAWGVPGGCQGYLWGVWWRPGKVSGRSWGVLGSSRAALGELRGAWGSPGRPIYQKPWNT